MLNVQLLRKQLLIAGVNFLKLLDEASAAAVTTTTDLWSSNLQVDRTQLVVDLGSSLSLYEMG